jgi:PhnB protein
MVEAKPNVIPEGYGSVTPWIATRDTARLLDFLKAAFDAVELARVEVDAAAQGGRAGDTAIGHAEARVGTSMVMMFDSPFDVDTPALLRLYVADADATFRKALDAGATSVTEVTALAFGDKVGRVRDPLGNIWWIQERVEQPTPEEIGARFADPTYAAAMHYVQTSLRDGLTTSA